MSRGLTNITKYTKKVSVKTIKAPQYWEEYEKLDMDTRTGNDMLLCSDGIERPTRHTSLIAVPEFEKDVIGGEAKLIKFTFKEFNDRKTAFFEKNSKIFEFPLGLASSTAKSDLFKSRASLVLKFLWNDYDSRYMFSWGSVMFVDVCLLRSLLMEIASNMESENHSNVINAFYHTLHTVRSHMMISSEYKTMLRRLADTTEPTDVLQSFVAGIVLADIDMDLACVTIAIRRIAKRCNRKKIPINLLNPDFKKSLQVISIVPYFLNTFMDVEGTKVQALVNSKLKLL